MSIVNTNTNIRIYEYISEPGIFNNIRDFAFGTPRSNYNRVIAEIKSSFNKNICGVYCRFRTHIIF